MKTRHRLPVLAFLGFLSLVGCTAHEDPAIPRDGVVTLYGTVESALGPERNAVIHVRAVSSGMEITVPTNPQGGYMVTLPAGRYRLCADPQSEQAIWYASSGLTYDSNQAEVFTISGEPGEMRVDFPLAALRLSIRIPVGSEDHDLYCDVVDLTSGRSVDVDRRQASDSTIVFEFRALLPGRVVLRLSNYDQQFWFPHALDSRNAEPIDLRSMQLVARRDSIGVAGRVIGQVRGPWMQFTYTRPMVRLYGPDSLIVSRDQQIDQDGTFDLPVLAEGDVRLLVEGASQYLWLGGNGFADAVPLNVTFGSVVDAGSIQTHGIACRLIGEPDWTGGHWQGVLFDGERLSEAAIVPGEAVGSWFIPLTRAGEYALKVGWPSPKDWRPQWYDRARSMAEATRLPVDDSVSPTSIDIRLERGGTISGRVSLQDSTPIVNGILVARLGSEQYGSWRTGEDGAFRINGLPDGPIRFAIYHEQDAIWYPGVLAEGDATPIEIVDGSDRAGIEFVLPDTGLTGFRYVGGTACKPCHIGEAHGAIWESWSASAHSGAYQRLDPVHRESPDCLGCHTTGYGRPVAVGRELSDLLGVQCEACHGPGSDYKSLTVMRDPVKAAELGLIYPSEGTCTQCHATSLPRECWGAGQASPVFDYVRARELIVHNHGLQRS